MSKEDVLKVERDGRLVILTMNRPQAYNALDADLAHALLDAAIACDMDDDVGAVMLTGEGVAFGAGGDLRAMEDNADEKANAGAFLKLLTVPLHEAIATFAHMQKPLVTAVNGVAAGAGFSIALAGDLVLAASSATFTSAYTKIALAPDGSSTFYLPLAVGWKKAYEIMVLNPVLTAQEAADLGIVSRIFEDATFAKDARALCKELAEGPTIALGTTKRLLRNSAYSSLETQMEHERQAIAACVNTADGVEGRRAFLDKRKPRFTGS